MRYTWRREMGLAQVLGDFYVRPPEPVETPRRQLSPEQTTVLGGPQHYTWLEIHDLYRARTPR
jgi:hypothetical protein